MSGSLGECCRLSEKMMRIEIFGLTLILLLFGDAWSIREVRLTVEPAVVVRGGTATLKCERELQGLPLYVVKWYRGNFEFYRYSPSEEPRTRIFEMPGIFVDMQHSDEHQVTLHRMDLALAGDFSCEVTADSPYFSTSTVHKHIDIIALPEGAPVLVTERSQYQPGELLRANCTSSASRPAANLTISVNNKSVTSSETQLFQRDDGLQWTVAHAQLRLSPDLFPGGRLRLGCNATVHRLYASGAALDLFARDAGPRPEKITYPNNSSSDASRVLRLRWLVLLLVLSVLFQSKQHRFIKQEN